MEKGKVEGPSGSTIYTLAQSKTGIEVKAYAEPVIWIIGKGTDMSDNGRMKARAKRKQITLSLMLALVDVAKAKGAEDRVKKYWNTYHCQNKVFSKDGRLYGNCCKNRFCPICSGNRKAELIRKYIPIIQGWEAPYFVTLSAKSVYANKLKSRMTNMVRAFRIIKERCNKRYSRGKGPKLVGVKCLECNFNPDKKWYNPHFHLIVQNKVIAELLIGEWKSLWTNKFTNKAAQYSKSVKDKEKSLIEVIKYSSKTFTEPGSEKKNGKKASPFIYASALDNIYAALKGHRVFDRFGFNLPKENKEETLSARLVTDFKTWSFEPELADWIENSTAQYLSGHKPTNELIMVLYNNIDKTIQ